MNAIRALFDGKAFIPQEPVSLPDQSEALVIVDEMDSLARTRLDDAIRAHYENKTDGEDDAWGQATAAQSQRAWDDE
jgi:hypothetical protein